MENTPDELRERVNHLPDLAQLIDLKNGHTDDWGSPSSRSIQMSEGNWNEWAQQITGEVGRLAEEIRQDRQETLELRAQMSRVENLLVNLSKRNPSPRVIYGRASVCGMIAGAIPVIVAIVLKVI